MATESVFTVSQEQFSSKTSRIFRQISRAVSGEGCEPTQGDIVLFGRLRKYKTDIVSVSCGRVQKTNRLVSSDCNNEDIYHWINFLFVKKDCQGKGYGKQMVENMEKILWSHSQVTIKIQSASKAVPFFKKMGYHEVGDPIECIYSGSALFKRLQVMEKHFKEDI